MDFLDKLVIPQSAEHIQLLHYLLIIILFLFIPFVSLVFGSTILSLYYKIKGIKESDDIKLKFAKDTIETLTINKSIGIILGIVPVITAILIYSQLLQGTNANISSYLVFSLLFVTIGLILIYIYRYSMSFMEIYNSVKIAEPQEEEIAAKISKYRNANIRLTRSGYYGIIFLFIGIWMFIASAAVASYVVMWGENKILYMMFFWKVLSHLFAFISASLALTGAAIFFTFFYWEGGKHLKDNIYKDFVKKVAARLSFTGTLSMPLFIFTDIFTVPENSLSGSIFFYTTLALILLFAAYLFLYSMVKNSDLKFSGHIFIVVLLALFMLIISNQKVLQNSTESQTVAMNARYEIMMAELTGAGKEKAAISGAQIYKNICSSCHSFDHKVVGPPYNQTLPKYEGHIDRLIAFIRNPTQNNPGYPPMPNPGLTPTEADSIAHYIMATYKK